MGMTRRSPTSVRRFYRSDAAVTDLRAAVTGVTLQSPISGQWSDWYLQELPSMQTSVQPAGLASRIDNWSTSYLNILSAI